MVKEKLSKNYSNFNRTTASVFKGSIAGGGGCDGWVPFHSGSSCASRAGLCTVFPIIFVL